MNAKTVIHVILGLRNALIPLEITLAVVYSDTVGMNREPAKVIAFDIEFYQNMKEMVF